MPPAIWRRLPWWHPCARNDPDVSGAGVATGQVHAIDASVAHSRSPSCHTIHGHSDPGNVRVRMRIRHQPDGAERRRGCAGRLPGAHISRFTNRPRRRRVNYAARESESAGPCPADGSHLFLLRESRSGRIADGQADQLLRPGRRNGHRSVQQRTGYEGVRQGVGHPFLLRGSSEPGDSDRLGDEDRRRTAPRDDRVLIRRGPRRRQRAEDAPVCEPLAV